MTLYEEEKYQMSLVQRQPLETDEMLARRLCQIQADVRSRFLQAHPYIRLNGGSGSVPFNELPPEVQERWVHEAKKYK